MKPETSPPAPGHKMLRRELYPKATVPPDAQGPIIDFRSSDQTLDRYQEVITVAGWKLDNYRKNPIFQNAHNYGSLADTIGKSLITEIRTDVSLSLLDSGTPYLFQRVLFAVEENPIAKLAYGLYSGGYIKGVSVGFIPIRWETGSQESGYRRKYLEQELLEVSAVSIPANPNALMLGLRAGVIEKSDLRELAALLKHFCKEDETRISQISCLADLTVQLNEIRALLKRA